MKWLLLLLLTCTGCEERPTSFVGTVLASYKQSVRATGQFIGYVADVQYKDKLLTNVSIDNPLRPQTKVKVLCKSSSWIICRADILNESN